MYMIPSPESFFHPRLLGKQLRRLSELALAAFRSGHHPGGPAYGMTPETAPERVHRHIETHHLGCVLEHIKLLYPSHQSAHPHAYQPDKHAPLPQTTEEALRFVDEHLSLIHI